MEPFDNQNQEQQPSFPNTPDANKWKVSGFAIDHLYQAAKWAGFLSLVGLISLGLSALMFVTFIFSFGTIAAFSDIPELGGASIVGGIVGLIFICLYALPIWWLYNFSSNIKQAIATGDSYRIEVGLNFLRKHYKFIGILMAIVLAFYALTFILGIVGGLFGILLS